MDNILSRMKKLNLSGTHTAIVTPFKADGTIDYLAFGKLVQKQIAGGIEGIVVAGSTGEGATLTSKEKQLLFGKAKEICNGKTLLIAGTGSNSTVATINNSLEAKEWGADALLIVTPYYNKPTQKGLYEHFKKIADIVEMPIILYNVPGRTGVNLLPDTTLELAAASPYIIATKEASGDLEQMMEIIKNAPSGFSLLSGDDALALPAITVGAKGIISVISNYMPKEFSDMIRLALKGKYKEAAVLHYEMFELMQINFLESNPLPVKTILSLMGDIALQARLPLQLPMKKENETKIRKVLLKKGLINK